MTNAELIKALKDAEGYMIYVAPNCYASCEAIKAIRAAADALEAADKRIAIVEEERDIERFAAKNYLDKIDELKARIAELEAQMAKEGEWIVCGMFDDFLKCSICGRSAPWTTEKYHYCPNCGARMQTVTECHALDER